MMENFRQKFARENLQKAKSGTLNEWEKRFVADIEKQIGKNAELTQEQYNKLKEIADLAEVQP